MKLEVGKKYKTLCGIHCICTKQELGEHGSFVFEFKIIGSQIKFKTKRSGCAFDDAGNQFNIVAEADIPVSVEPVEFFISQKDFERDGFTLRNWPDHEIKYRIDQLKIYRELRKAKEDSSTKHAIYRVCGFLAYEEVYENEA